MKIIMILEINNPEKKIKNSKGIDFFIVLFLGLNNYLNLILPFSSIQNLKLLEGKNQKRSN
tara:strand:- start:615 stop:797 length:183 start_codon:yes stop_codon:yes gene_type:complete